MTLRMSHIFGADQRVEFVAGEETELDCCVAQARVLMVRRVRHLSGVVVADFGG